MVFTYGINEFFAAIAARILHNEHNVGFWGSNVAENKHLTTLNIWEQTKIIDGKISFLEEMPNLKKIDIRKYTHYH